MNSVLQNSDLLPNYVNCKSQFAILEFKSYFFNMLSKYNHINKSIIFLCIGSDKITGDSLGPLVGYKLSKLPFKNNIFIYGTLDNPVHAKNLNQTIKNINIKHKNSIIIAIDASLGKAKYINYISLGQGSLKPGAGANKNLQPVGDIYIKGIINNNKFSISSLQNISLSLIMNMADIISYGIWHCVSGI